MVLGYNCTKFILEPFSLQIVEESCYRKQQSAQNGKGFLRNSLLISKFTVKLFGNGILSYLVVEMWRLVMLSGNLTSRRYKGQTLYSLLRREIELLILASDLQFNGQCLQCANGLRMFDIIFYCSSDVRSCTVRRSRTALLHYIIFPSKR